MARARLTRAVRFSAAHRYHRPEWTDAENRRAFGAGSNPHGHGHSYSLEVTVEGEIDPETGFSVDLSALDALLQRVVQVPLDHQHLNHVIPAFAEGGAIPTCENILVHLWPDIAGSLPAGTRLQRLRLHEDTTFFVDYFGGELPDGDVRPT